MNIGDCVLIDVCMGTLANENISSFAVINIVIINVNNNDIISVTNSDI